MWLLNAGKVEIWTPVYVCYIHGLHVHVHRTDSRLTSDETREAITNQAKPNSFSFLHLPESLWAKSCKYKIKSQETPSNWTY